MADVKIEDVALAVTFTVDAYKDLPAYRDTLHVDPASTRTEWMAAAQDRYQTWADRVRNPPTPEPVAPPSTTDALVAAQAALEQAQATVADAIAAQPVAEPAPAEG